VIGECAGHWGAANRQGDHRRSPAGRSLRRQTTKLTRRRPRMKAIAESRPRATQEFAAELRDIAPIRLTWLPVEDETGQVGARCDLFPRRCGCLRMRPSDLIVPWQAERSPDERGDLLERLRKIRLAAHPGAQDRLSPSSRLTTYSARGGRRARGAEHGAGAM